MAQQTEAWGSRVGLILAMAGNAVGLGNFLRFPVQAVNNGGGAFIIPYLVCFLLMGIPLVWIEWSIGRFGGRLGHHSAPFIMNALNRRKIWQYIGVFGIFTNLVIAAYYCYIESWTLAYLWHSLKQSFAGLSQSGVVEFFDSFTALSTRLFGIRGEALIFFIFTLGLNTYILSKGIKGVEKVAKIAMPLLILFGIFLAIKGLTLGTSGASEEFPNANSWAGLNFMWTPQYDSLAKPGVWLAAAGQIFFTLSVGLGVIQTYASYVGSREDIALNGVTAGFTNEFVEVVLGSVVVVSIAAGYLGIGWVQENMSFGMAFQTMPYLFGKWGPLLATLAGVMWFGLLFFAGITSSLALGTPWMGFMRDEFNFSRVRGAVSFGLILLMLGLPTVLFYGNGFFDEYDYWGGTVSLVIFATAETILFAWIYGMNKGWKELTLGSDIRIPIFFKFVMRYITPVVLLLVFIGAVITPMNNAWELAISDLFHGRGWNFDNSSLIMQLANKGLRDQIAMTTDPELLASLKDRLLFTSIARALLTLTFAIIAYLVFLADRKRKREQKLHS